MSRKVNTLELCLYNGPKASWRGGWRRCVVYWRDARYARLLDLDALVTYRVSVKTLCLPYMETLGDPLRGTLKRLGTWARKQAKYNPNLPLETIGSILEAGKRRWKSLPL